MHAFALIASGAAVLASMPSVQGHGYMVHPEAQWVEGFPNNGYGSTIDNEVWGVYDNAKYGYGPNATLKFFTETFPTKGYKSLGAFIIENQEIHLPNVDPDCGLTVYKDSARSELPASELTYTSFTHPGPCEVWCDDTKVLFDSDCQTKYPNKPATMPYVKSKCVGANRMTIYRVAVHADPWQSYINCMWLKGGSGIGAPPTAVGKSKLKGGAASNSTATSTPAPATPSTSADSSATLLAPSTAVVSTEASGSDEEASSEANDSSVGEVSFSAGDSSEEETPTAATTPSVAIEQGDTAVTALPATEAPSASNASTGAKCVRRRS